MTAQRYAVIVVGGGHAGIEAAAAAARSGARTLLLTQNLDTLGQLSCNPAVGGIGKSQIVREIDALGGIMGKAADYAGIHFRRLNTSRGPAVRALRAQTDRTRYKQAISRALDAVPNLHRFQAEVSALEVQGGRVIGLTTHQGFTLHADAVVLTAGTFLRGRLHVGAHQTSGGRAGERAVLTLARQLAELDLRVGRLKTGTPPRIDGRTLNFKVLEPQPGQTPPPLFSFTEAPAERPRQVACHIAYTNPETHAVISESLDESPLFNGAIEGAGPRYCPSLEDKVVRFPDRPRHQIFVEPEGLDTQEIYPNGISTSLAFDVQQRFVRTIQGFENAVITRPGYAIEYDFLDPRDLECSLQSRRLPGLFLAGQINGTTGYEEAAGQGLIAGLNAARHTRGQEAWWPTRAEAYLGVLLDDLTRRGVTEPYRMFTSRAEYRLHLREDNADVRLTERGFALGLVEAAQLNTYHRKRTAVLGEFERLKNTRQPAGACPPGNPPLKDAVTLYDLLRRPNADYRALCEWAGLSAVFDDEQTIEHLQAEITYGQHLERQRAEIERLERHEKIRLPDNFEYAGVPGLSNEVRERLTRARPQTLGQAARLDGITPAAIALMLVHLKRRALV